MLRMGLRHWIVAAAVAAVVAVIAPSAWAHGANHHQSDDVAANEALSGGGMPAGARAHDPETAVVFAAPARAGTDESCPGGGSGPADHPGCCTAIGHCATGCGAAIVTAMTTITPSRRHLGPGAERPPGLEIVAELTDPPPRSSV